MNKKNINVFNLQLFKIFLSSSNTILTTGFTADALFATSRNLGCDEKLISCKT